jgi:hypothetical protein
MAVPRSTLFIILATLLIAWLLVSSVHLLQPHNSGGVSSTTNGGGGGDLGASWHINLPQMNFTRFHLPNITLTWPHFRFPSFKLPDWHFPWWGLGGFGNGKGLGSGNGNGNGQGSVSGSGGATGTQSGANQGAAAQTASATTIHQQPVIVIPPVVLLIITAIVLVVAGVAFVSRAKRNPLRKIARKKKTQQDGLLLPPPIAPVAAPPQIQKEKGLELEGQEFVSTFAGWGAMGGFVKPRINQSLPLIWGLGAELKVDAPQGASVSSEQSPVVAGSDGSFGVTFANSCNVLRGKLEEKDDYKWVRAVRYNEDVIKHFRLNLLGNEKFQRAMETKTPREIVEEIAKSSPALIGEPSKLSDLTTLFEKAFYGRKEISRQEYESFLLSLSGALADPKVIICGPK